MKKLTKIISMVLCLALAISLCACGGESVKKSSAADDETKHAELTWYIRSSEPDGFAEVMEAANEYLNEKLNVTLNIQCIEPGDYGQKVQLALASGEKADIIWTANWGGFNYESNITKGAFLALDEYLDLPELAELKGHYSDGIWEATRSGGKIYGIPMEQVMHTQQGYFFNTAISEKYSLVDKIRGMAWVDENNHGTMEEMEEVFEIVRNGEPKEFNIAVEGIRTFDKINAKVSNYYIIDDKVDDRLESELEYAKRMRKWNLAGYFPADMATLSNSDSLKKQGKVFCGYQKYLPGVEGKMRLTYDFDNMVIPTSNRVINRSGVQATLNAIAANCENPVRALKLLNLMLKDEYMLNLISYGIEGRDYTKDPENPKRMNRDSDSYYISEYMVGSQFLAYLAPSYEDGVWEQTRYENETADIDGYIGFSFDSKPVESEISQCSAVINEYSSILNHGLEDPEVNLEEREKKLQLAGKQVIMDEIQRQLDEWLAVNK